MTYLLDSNVVIAACILEHPDHSRAISWLAGKSTAVSPLAQLAFLRLAMQIYGAGASDAQKSLSDFMKHHTFLSDDFSAEHLPTAQGHKQWNDLYFVNLAKRHKMKLASFDGQISSEAVEVIG